jgi:endonuclease III
MKIDMIEVMEIINRLRGNTEDVKRLKEIFEPIHEQEQHKMYKRERDIKWSWKDFDPRIRAERAFSLLSVLSHFNEAETEVRFHDTETIDILHALELLDMDKKESLELLENLKTVRLYRRKAKDFLEIAKPLRDFVSKNEHIFRQLVKVNEDIKAKMDKLEDRTYTPRVSTAMEEAFKKASVSA